MIGEAGQALKARVKIVVVEVRGATVRLGITADDHLHIGRDETHVGLGGLVLQRAKDDAIYIGTPGDVLDEPIRVRVLEIRGTRVRLRIGAQRVLRVMRAEVADADDAATRAGV